MEDEGHFQLVNVEMLLGNRNEEIVKEEPLEYMEGYSLADEKVDDEKEGELSSLDPTAGDADMENTKNEDGETPTGEGSSGIKDKVLKCKECPKTYRSLRHLRNHEYLHTSEQITFACDECDKKFEKKPLWTRHKLVHSGVKSLECAECGKMSRGAHNLVQHKLTHSDVRPFLCDHCGNGFKTSKELNQHVMTHLESKPFECDDCGKKFTRPYQANQHKMTHSGLIPYECDRCDKKFQLKRGLLMLRHRKKH